jgi:hypothetical protein
MLNLHTVQIESLSAAIADALCIKFNNNLCDKKRFMYDDLTGPMLVVTE